MLKPCAQRVVISEMGTNRTSDELAHAGVGIYIKILAHLSSVLGKAESEALFRSSLRFSPIPFLNEIRARDPQTLRDALHTALQQQEPDVMVDASITQFTVFLELLATFVGVRLTLKFASEVWPQEVLPIHAEEMRNE